MKKRLGAVSVLTLLVMALCALSAFATTAEIWLSSDSSGETRVSLIQEGDQVWIVVSDPDNNIDCDVRDKFWGDMKIMDPKTGAYIIWNNGGHYGLNLHDDTPALLTTTDYFEETGADTGLFVSSRPFQIGTREDYAVVGTPDAYRYFTHVVDEDDQDFQWGHYLYTDLGDDQFDTAAWLLYTYVAAGPSTVTWTEGIMSGGGTWSAGHIVGTIVDTPHNVLGPVTETYTVGRFENMDTLIAMYQDPNDDTDVAIGLAKIIDTEGTIEWDAASNGDVYKDYNEAASVTIVDADENLNCNKVEYVPFFVLVNPGSWNQLHLQTRSYTTYNSFCSLKWNGGYDVDGTAKLAINWFNIYEDRYIHYPRLADGDALADYKTLFDTNGTYILVTFYAKETGVSTGVFKYNFNKLSTDLGFYSLKERDVLVAYYLDPNDEDDFTLATAYIGEKQHSLTSFTDASRAEKNEYWLGRDPVYVQVIDANANVDPCCPEQVVVHICDPHGEDDTEWLVLDETSSNSYVFFTNAGTELEGVWDPLGVGLADGRGGYQLVVDNWKIEAFNEDHIYARYNDVYYETDEDGMTGLGDQSMGTAFPPQIERVRVFNDVSFDLMSIKDTQVYNGSTVNMKFLDRNGNQVGGEYLNSDCVFLQVTDDDQDEDLYRRERIDGYWDGGQNVPFGPQAINPFHCDLDYPYGHGVNFLLGDTNIFNDSPATSAHAWGATGVFVSVTCIDLVSVYTGCVPTLDVLAGDTILAFYQDPTNHSDSAMISSKVAVGGGSSTTTGSQVVFTDEDGATVSQYTDADRVYVKVTDSSHAGATSLSDAIAIDGDKYDLTASGTTGTFVSGALDLDLTAGEPITVTYTDPNDSSDTDTATATIIASELDVTGFYAGPNPFDDEVVFSYEGSGIATTFSVEIYDLAGHLVWAKTEANTAEVSWTGVNNDGDSLANGAYIYVVTATDGTNTFDQSNTDSAKGLVFINR
ncbi:MAG: T9SS type A sorting domain-containing protein [Candidatus Bipolaricaulota bacterium]|nr:T9SS type A sorting domain-containing protein [Candidatus Bipolaricaulota bacterium]